VVVASCCAIAEMLRWGGRPFLCDELGVQLQEPSGAASPAEQQQVMRGAAACDPM
jgi:hypothetical protein